MQVQLRCQDGQHAADQRVRAAPSPALEIRTQRSKPQQPGIADLICGKRHSGSRGNRRTPQLCLPGGKRPTSTCG